MPRQPKPLQPAEIAAIKAAEVEWLGWWRIEQALPNDIGRQEITKIREATKGMARALDVLTSHHTSREMSQLIGAMQELQGFRHHQGHYRQMIDELVEPLQLLGLALARTGGGGIRALPTERDWVCKAADAWIAAGLPQPTAKGRFFRALRDTEKAPEIPNVTEERVNAALKDWRSARAYSAGKSD